MERMVLERAGEGYGTRLSRVRAQMANVLSFKTLESNRQYFDMDKHLFCIL
jgi:hypothetical protein